MSDVTKEVTNLTPNGVIIQDIVFQMDPLYQIYPAIRIDPPITIQYNKEDKNAEWIFNMIPLIDGITSECETIGVGSKVDIIQEKTYIQPLNDDTTTKKIVDMILPKVSVSLRDDSPTPTDDRRLIIKTCPSCGEDIQYHDGFANCRNSNCPAKTLEDVIRFIRHVKIQLHGPFFAIMKQLVLDGKIKNPYDLFTTPEIDVEATAAAKNDKYVFTYKELINEVIGNVTMAQFLLGLGIVPDFAKDHQLLNDFIRFEHERMKAQNKLFDIPALIELGYDTVKEVITHLDMDSDKDQFIAINDFFIAMPEDFKDKLKELWGNISKYDIALLLAYLAQPQHREMLRQFHNLNILNVS